MPLNRSQREIAIEKLLITKNKGHRLEIRLRFQGKAAEAKQVKDTNDVLSKEIDRLLVEIMEAWTGNAATIETALRTNNTRLQATIRDIRKKIKVAEKVVKAIGYLDKAIELARKLRS